VALRILYELGFHHVYLLGADFSMELGKQNYHFKQDRSASAVKNNNDTYRILNTRFDKLRPVFEKQGFNVYNCLINSGLKSFDHISYEDALAAALAHIPAVEKPEGLYDRKAKLEEEEKEAKTKGRKSGTAKTFVEFLEKVNA